MDAELGYTTFVAWATLVPQEQKDPHEQKLQAHNMLKCYIQTRYMLFECVSPRPFTRYVVITD